MEKSAHGAVSRGLLTGSRVIFGAAAVAAVILGYLGLREWIASLPVGTYGSGVRNVIYYDLQLFVLGSDPLQSPGPYPVTLDIARFAAPMATVYAVFEAARALFAEEWSRWRNRVRRGHAIVIGDTSLALNLFDQLSSTSRRRRRVYTMEQFAPDELVNAGIAGASEVYVCADDTDDSTLNVAIAQVVARAPRARFRPSTVSVYAHVSTATLALGLRARWLGQTEYGHVDVDFFNVDEIAARASLRPGDFQVPADREPHILVAGLGAFGRALLVAYAQQWQLESERPRDRVRVTVVGATEDDVRQLTAQWRCVKDVCDIQVAPGDIDAALTASSGPLPHRTYICYEDENDALFAALTVARLWRGGRDSVVVRLNRFARHDSFAAGSPRPAERELIGQVGGQLRLVSVTTEACQPGRIGLSLVERLAESTHNQYLRDQLHAGVKIRAWPSLVPWSELSEEYRDANRALARDIGRKLSKIHATVAPRTGFNDPFAFTTAEEEELARQEHDRWWRSRLDAGWRYGPERDNAKKIHPSLVDWDQLPDSERQKDREAVRGMIEVLANVGLEVVRLSDPNTPARPVTPIIPPGQRAETGTGTNTR